MEVTTKAILVHYEEKYIQIIKQSSIMEFFIKQWNTHHYKVIEKLDDSEIFIHWFTQPCIYLTNTYWAPDYVSGDVKLETWKIYSTQKFHRTFEFRAGIENAELIMCETILNACALYTWIFFTLITQKIFFQSMYWGKMLHNAPNFNSGFLFIFILLFSSYFFRQIDSGTLLWCSYLHGKLSGLIWPAFP